MFLGARIRVLFEAFSKARSVTSTDLWQGTECRNLFRHLDDSPDAEFGDVDEVGEVGLITWYAMSIIATADDHRILVSGMEVEDGGRILLTKRYNATSATSRGRRVRVTSGR